jgi:fatty-acyl-CoA synthase
MNLSHFVRQAARRHGAEVGLVWGDMTWTWAVLDRRIDAMAAALAAKGVGKGDRVLVQSKNCNQLFETMFACFRLGAVWVPTNFRQTPEEVAYLGEASGASAMICQSEFAGHAAAARATMLGLRFVVSIGPSDFGEDYDELACRHDGQPVTEATVDYDDPCWFFFTSGTTGRPKAAVLTHGQMAFVVTNHLCDHAGNHIARCFAGSGAAIARRRHPSTGAERPCGEDRAAVERALRCRRSLAVGCALARH